MIRRQGGIMETTKQLLGRRIKELRKNGECRRTSWAERIGVDPKQPEAGIETGNGYPSLDTLEEPGRRP